MQPERDLELEGTHLHPATFSLGVEPRTFEVYAFISEQEIRVWLIKKYTQGQKLVIVR
jgi:hypothetical protein